VVPLSGDSHEDLVKMPFVLGLRLVRSQFMGVGRFEHRTQLPDGLVRDNHPAGGHRLLHFTEAQRVPAVRPHAVADDLCRVATAPVRRRHRIHAKLLPDDEQPEITSTVNQVDSTLKAVQEESMLAAMILSLLAFFRTAPDSLTRRTWTATG
jgi:hypothetical protein